MPAQQYVGSATISTTEYSLPRNAAYDSASPQTASPGVYQLWLDLATLTSIDQYRLRIYESASGGGAQRVVYESFFSGAQSQPMTVVPSLVLLHRWDMTMARVAGSDRGVTWSIRVP